MDIKGTPIRDATLYSICGMLSAYKSFAHFLRI